MTINKQPTKKAATKTIAAAVGSHLGWVCFTLGASRIPEAVASSREAAQCWLDHTSTA
jgi:hypothetical protein